MSQTEFTDIDVSVTIPVTGGTATLVGRKWRVHPLLPITSAEGDNRNYSAAPHGPLGGITSIANYITSATSTDKSKLVDVWTGIRYAAPPLPAWPPDSASNRRWKIAQIYNYPAGSVNQCKTWGDVPIQTYEGEGGSVGRPEWGVGRGAYNWGAYDLGGTKESEDCLTLNIWRPTGDGAGGGAPAGGWPILFWIHGGAWTVNSAIAYQSRGHRLAAHKGVMVVTVGYRLGSFGFFHVDEETDETAMGGPNFAYTDIKRALKWVYDKAASFGANPNKICIGGTSAGGAAVQALMEDESQIDGVLVRNLFGAAYCSSGGGAGDRRGPSRTPYGSPPYADFYRKFTKTIDAMKDLIPHYTNKNKSLGDAISEYGRINGMRSGLSPNTILGFSNATANRVNNNLLYYGNPGGILSADGNVNIYPFRGNGITNFRATDAARDGKFVRPFISLVVENEAGNLIDISSAGRNTRDIFPSINEFKSTPFNGNTENPFTERVQIMVQGTVPGSGWWQKPPYAVETFERQSAVPTSEELASGNFFTHTNPNTTYWRKITDDIPAWEKYLPVGMLSRFARNIGFPDKQKYMANSWAQSLWQNTEYIRHTYRNSVFAYPAWLIAYNMSVTNSAPRWLVLFNYATGNPSVPAARILSNHSTDVHFLFGNNEWNTDMLAAADPPKARVTLAALYASEIWMQMIANYCNSISFTTTGSPPTLTDFTANPNTHYNYNHGFKIFHTSGSPANGPAISMTQFSHSSPNDWIAFGKMPPNPVSTPANSSAHNATDSYPTIINGQQYLTGLWDAIRNRKP